MIANGTVRIIQFKEEYIPELRRVFYSSIHENAKKFYNREQLEAWAPILYDEDAWSNRIRKIKPFIAIFGEVVVGYADLQSDGYIDHFFVRGGYSDRGVATALMRKLFEVAKMNGLELLYSHVSLAAQRFFEKNGFKILRNQVVDRGEIKIENALMELATASIVNSGGTCECSHLVK